MTVLAIDTSATLCAAALLDAVAGRVLASEVRDIGKGHAEVLMDVIETALARAGITYGDLSRIVVTVGPGSFTGVRIGVSAARGFALALGVPAVGITTLEAIAADEAALHPGKPVLAVIDAGRGEVYAGLFAPSGEVLRGPAILAIADAAAWVMPDMVVAGSGAALVAAAAGLPDLTGSVIAATGTIETVARLGAGKDPAQAVAKPLYLRGHGAKSQAGFALARKAQ